MEPAQFTLMQAETAAGRMDALCRFIEFWLGPRKEDYGEPADAAGKIPLPMPLRQIYEFAGRWPSRDDVGMGEFVVPALSHQDHLLKLSRITTAEDGKLTFVSENQGVWDCRTALGAEDPPVWCVGDQVDEKREDFRGEKLICESLSRFLTTFVLRELIFESGLVFYDDNHKDGELCALFEREKADAGVIWMNGPYVYGCNNHFHLWRNVSVYHSDDSYWFAANDQGGIEFLRQQQGPPRIIRVMAGRRFDLTIEKNGSSLVSYRNETIYEKGTAPPGTFEYDSLLGVLSRDTSKAGHYERNPMFFFHRRYESTTRGQHLHDFQVAKSLFRTAIDFSNPPNEQLRRRFESEYPF